MCMVGVQLDSNNIRLFLQKAQEQLQGQRDTTGQAVPSCQHASYPKQTVVAAVAACM